MFPPHVIGVHALYGGHNGQCSDPFSKKASKRKTGESFSSQEYLKELSLGVGKNWTCLFEKD